MARKPGAVRMNSNNSNERFVNVFVYYLCTFIVTWCMRRIGIVRSLISVDVVVVTREAGKGRLSIEIA